MAGRRLPFFGIGLIAAGITLIAVGGAFGRLGSSPGQVSLGFGPGGMMGYGDPNSGSAPGPGAPGFVAGTAASPRVVRLVATGQLRFVPDVVTVRQGETITFEITTVGMSVHEFMVGPAVDVAADSPGTPEIADIGMMQTRSLTYTFVGTGPFAFACHAPGHYEDGMRGTIVVVP